MIERCAGHSVSVCLVGFLACALLLDCCGEGVCFARGTKVLSFGSLLICPDRNKLLQIQRTERRSLRCVVRWMRAE